MTRTILLALTIAVIIVAFSAVSVSADELGSPTPAMRLGAACDLDRAVSGSWTDHMTMTSGSMDANHLYQLANWQGNQIAWLDDGNGYGYFDAPVFQTWPVEYQFTLDDGIQRWVFVWTDGETNYVYGFYNLDEYADSNGEHYGVHNFCAYMRVPNA